MTTAVEPTEELLVERVAVRPPVSQAQRLGAGVMTLGMPIGLAVILFTVIITAIYVRRANGEFDTLTAQITHGVLK